MIFHHVLLHIVEDGRECLNPFDMRLISAQGKVSVEMKRVQVYLLFLKVFDDTISIKLSCVLNFRHVWSRFVFL